MKKIKEVFKDTNLYFFIAITVFFFISLSKLEYATDTYSVFNFDSKALFHQFASSGRFITAIVGVLFKVLRIKNGIMYILSYAMALVCIIGAQYKLYIIIRENVSNNIFRKLIQILIIINIY